MHGSITSVFILLTISLLNFTKAEYCIGRAAECEFFFDGYPDEVPSYDICDAFPGDPYFTNAIHARNGDILGAMNSNESVKVLVDWSFVDISTLGAALTRSQFKPVIDSGEPTITFETFQSSSMDLVIDSCIGIDFTSWQTIGPDGNISGNENTPTATSCVVFKISCGANNSRARLL